VTHSETMTTAHTVQGRWVCGQGDWFARWTTEAWWQSQETPASWVSARRWWTHR